MTKKLLDYIKNKPNSLNFKGFMLGNPYTNPDEQIKGQMAHFAGSSLIPPSLFNKFSSSCVIDETKDE